MLPVTIERERAYEYVLGMYLGDGHIARVGRTYALRVYLDPKYPGIAERCAAATAELNPFHRVRIRRRGTANVVVVSACGQCLDSDGCRYVRHVDGHDYGAYDFRNRSEDILRLFWWVCDLLGVGYTKPSEYTITIARRADVTRLDLEFGPKS